MTEPRILIVEDEGAIALDLERTLPRPLALHGAPLQVASQPGRGSTFSFTLPRLARRGRTGPWTP